MDTTNHRSAPSRKHRESPQGIRDRLVAALPVTERHLVLNGVATAVLEGGSGPPIVLLHGPGAYGAQWIRVIPDLDMDYRIVAPDLPGHGASSFFADELSVERACGWLEDLIECTCSTNPVLVGHTLGGAIAAQFAALHRKRIASLVLVDTLGLVDFQPSPAFGAALQAFLGAPSEHTHDGLWSQCVLDLTSLRSRLGDQWELIKQYNLVGVQTPAGIAALSAWMKVFGLPAIPADTLARIEARTTLIWGRHDRATSLSAAQDAHARYRWDLQIIDGAADDPAIEQPDAFLSALRRTLGPSSVSSPSRSIS